MSRVKIQESSEISSAEWLSVNQFLYEVKQIDSACISVYYPYGKGQETISLLQKTKRKESLEKIELKIEKKITKLICKLLNFIILGNHLQTHFP